LGNDILTMAADRLDTARKELVRADLIAYQHPLYQVISLDGRRLSSARGTKICSIKEIFKRIGGGGGSCCVFRAQGKEYGFR
jgi:hypothetical protein